MKEGLVEATWLPYELHPEIPLEGMPMEDFFPPAYHARIAAAPWAAMAAEEGLVMKRGGRLINTRLALSAAEFARDHGMYDQMHAALFRGHWEQTADLADIEDLKRIATEVGLDSEEMVRALGEGRYEELLDANRREATQVGINGIPAHVFGMRYLVMGAQPYEVLKQVADKVVLESAARPEEGEP